MADQVSTEMRDTARLVNGRVAYDRAVIMARAWKAARREHAACPEIGLRQCFAEALKQVWTEAKAVAFRLAPAPVLSRREALRLVVVCAEMADRPTARDVENLAAARAARAALSAAA